MAPATLIALLIMVLIIGTIIMMVAKKTRSGYGGNSIDRGDAGGDFTLESSHSGHGSHSGYDSGGGHDGGGHSGDSGGGDGGGDGGGGGD